MMEGLVITAILIFSALNNICYAGETCSNSSLGEPLILTPYIERGDLETARNLSKFKILGWTGYSGFLTVNESCGGQLFFIFVPAKNNSKNAPVFVWLNGGPAISSLLGFFREMGPFRYNVNTNTISRRKYTWNRNNNILYVDQPVGTGFSFPKNSCLAHNITQSSEQLYTAVVQFFQLFPGYLTNKCFITGESYAAYYIAFLAYHIHLKNQQDDVQVKINLTGTLIGNPSTQMACRNYSQFLYNLGFITIKSKEVINENYRKYVNLSDQGDFQGSFDYWAYTLSLIDNITGLQSRNYVLPEKQVLETYWLWLNTSEARCNLHVGNATYNYYNEDVYAAILLDITKTQPVLGCIEQLLNWNYSMTYFSGNLDLICLTTSTDCMLYSLEWWGAEGFRSANRTPWFHNEVHAGYVQQYGNLGFVVISGAGHMVPRYKPEQMLDVINCIDFPCEDNTYCRLNTTVP